MSVLKQSFKFKHLADQIARTSYVTLMKFATANNKDQLQLSNMSNEKPVKFINSPAHKWKAKYSREGPHEDNSPWYQPHVIAASLTVFLVYFCILREESDIDEQLGRSLYTRIDGLEELQLRLSYNYNKEHGIDVADIERRMKELGAKPEKQNP